MQGPVQENFCLEFLLIPIQKYQIPTMSLGFYIEILSQRSVSIWIGEAGFILNILFGSKNDDDMQFLLNT